MGFSLRGIWFIVICRRVASSTNFRLALQVYCIARNLFYSLDYTEYKAQFLTLRNLPTFREARSLTVGISAYQFLYSLVNEEKS